MGHSNVTDVAYRVKINEAGILSSFSTGPACMLPIQTDGSGFAGLQQSNHMHGFHPGVLAVRCSGLFLSFIVLLLLLVLR